MNIDNYLNLITSEHRDKPIFVANLSIPIKGAVDVQDVFSEMINAYDLDVAVGVQLDKIGEWVGVGRFVVLNQDNEKVTVELDDPFYRTLIKAKIAANKWNGTIPDAYEVWEEIFSTSIIIQDNQNMSMVVGLVGDPLDAMTQSLLVNGYLSLKPEGVMIDFFAVPVDTNPLFAWDIESDALAGWETGSWAKIIKPS